MTKKTRIRVARIAAGAVIAAGASLTAAGAAQAMGIGDDTVEVEVQAGLLSDGDPGGVDSGGAAGETTTG
ncbi:hypothetical protein B9W61_23215, partial [Streptomyces sp. CS057]